MIKVNLEKYIINMEDNNCSECKKEIKNTDELVRCDGVCNRVYHFKCLSFNITSYKFYCQCRNLKYICDDCTDHPDNMMNGIVKKLFSYLCIIDERLNRQGDSLTNIKKDIENVMIAIKDKDVPTNMKVSDNKLNNPKSYANVTIESTNQSTCEKVNAANATIVLKPKNKQNCNYTRADLSKNVNPAEYEINEVRNIQNGGIAINCNSNDVNKLMNAATTKFSEK